MARKSKKQTLKEFQAWLQGIKEIQPDDWTPTADQWKMIYEKILNIKEEAPPAPAPAPVQQQPMMPGGYAAPAPAYPAPPAPSHIPVPPPDVEISPAAKELLEKGKTPDAGPDTPSPFV